MLKHLYFALAFVAALFIGPSCARTAEQDGLGHHHHHHGEEAHDHEHEAHDHDHEDHEGHDHHDHEHEGHSHEAHAGAITLDPHQAEEFGVEVTEIQPGEFSDIVKVSGQVVPAPTDRSVVSATSSGVVDFSSRITEGARVSSGTVIARISGRGIAGGDANEAARVALDAAKKELDRAVPLHESRIISTKDFNVIKQAYEQAKASYSGNASGSTAIARQNGVISQLLVKQGEYVEVGQPIAAISGNTRLTLRADLPEKYYDFLPTVSSANFRPTYSKEVVTLADLNGKLVSAPSAAVANQSGYIPVYFSFDNNGRAVSGAYAEVYLIGTRRNNVISVPVSAISEQQGAKFVYIRLDEDCYEKRPVTLGNGNGNEIEIISGVNPGENVVTKGMTFVRLAETSGVVPEGHSHTH